MNTDLREQLQSVIGTGCVIERELGGGGMSRVFLARDTQLDRLIVVKVLPPEMAGAVSVDRFKREIQLSAKLQHPHIVPVLSAAREGEILYYTMPYIEGESLGARLTKSGALSVMQSVSVLRDSIRALAYAHRHGVIHRDIKPDNILLSEDSALVADFGIAKALSVATETQQALTTAGMSVGTPAYMAPEQSVGDPSVDHRADIYSIGAVAYEMLTGQHPFAGKSAQQMMAAHVMEAPTSITARNPLVPAQLASLVMRCLEKEPARRPQTADELLHDLDAAVTQGSGTSVISALGRSKGRIAATIAVLAVLLVTSGALAFAPKDKVATAMALMRRNAATLHNNRIIVAPFENETGDPKLAPLGSMAADWVAQGLTRAGGLEVVDARTTQVTGEVVDRIPWPFKSRDRGRALAEETGAGILLSGTIYKDGDTLRIQAKMSDVATGNLRLALTPVSGPASAPTKVLEELSRRAIATLVQAADTAVLQDLGTYSEPPSVQAYEAARKGVELYFKHDTAGYAALERAIALDSNYATPVVFLAFSRTYRGDFAEAHKAVAHAQRLRERMTPAERAMLDHVEAELRGDAAAAMTTSEDFMRSTPGSMESPILVASTALATGQPRRALQVLAQVDPDRGLNLGSGFYWYYHTIAYVALADYKKALEFAREGYRRFPRDGALVSGYMRALAGAGEIDELNSVIDDAESVRAPRIVAQGVRAWRGVNLLRITGRKAEADALGRKWLPVLGAQNDSLLPVLSARANLLGYFGRWQEAEPLAVSLYARSTDNFSRSHWLSVLAVIAARKGNRKEASRIDAELAKIDPQSDLGFATSLRARIAAHSGDRERALSLMRQAMASGVNLQSPESIFLYDVWMSPMATDPGFQSLVKDRH